MKQPQHFKGPLLPFLKSLLSGPVWLHLLRRYSLFPVYYQQSELGSAKLCSRLSTPDAGGHEMAVRGA